MFKSKIDKLEVFLKDSIGDWIAKTCGAIIILLTICIIWFIGSKGLSFYSKYGHNLIEIILEREWNPEAVPGKFGALSFILGSTIVSFGAVLISTPISIGTAVFMRFISPRIGKKIMQPALELFVGIPSVVYGWIGITAIVPIIKVMFGGIGFSLLAGIIVLSIMILPTITSLAYDALSGIPRGFIEGSYALGATRCETIFKIIIPASKNGILTGVILGLARAFGEALAVTMVIGNTVRLPFNLLKPMSTLTGIITMDMANTFYGTEWNDALWGLALLLLVNSCVFILVIKVIGRRGED